MSLTSANAPAIPLVSRSPPIGVRDILSACVGDDPTVLEARMVFHIPPALRVPRQYGLGFSETVLVTKTGCEVLTRFPLKLHVVDG